MRAAPVRSRLPLPGAILAALAAVVAAALGPAAAPAAAAPQLEVGAGRADITPPTGYYMMGWVRSDGLVIGQHTRLWARTLVLKQGGRKVALVAMDLNGISGGMIFDAAERLKKRGFSAENILVSASHTHAAPTGYYNFDTFNTVFMTIDSPTDFQLTGGFDPTLYQFMVRQLARSIRRADRDLAPGEVGWGRTRITHLTRNRSIEAHLHDHGLDVPYGDGSAAMDPRGRLHTIDPEANVLRVDKTAGGRRVPIGMWSTFADHGTVNRFQFSFYNEDHHGAATLLSERRVRRRAHVPHGQRVVTVYGNTDEGDQSAGLDRYGPAYAEHVGRVESRAFMRAWRQAGRRMSGTLRLDTRWTRMCFCGQQTSEGPVDDRAKFGLAQLTGSEEGRGPLYDLTRTPFEGRTGPPSNDPQGDKIVTLQVDVPAALPLLAVRLGNRMVVSVPGEITAEAGRRLRAAVVRGTRRHGIRRAVISGLAQEYADYFTTPEEYDTQHYEGASTVFGRTTTLALTESVVEVAKAAAARHAAPKPYEFDQTNGITPDGSRFPKGARAARVVEQPSRRARRLQHPSFSWQGGARGYDRPLDRAFIRVQRRVHGPGRRWRTVDQDLGLRVLWYVDDDGVYTARWEPPLYAAPGRYRFRVRARRYAVASRGFRLGRSRALTPRRVGAPPGRVAVVLDYPAAAVHEDVGDPAPDLGADITYRPRHARGGRVRFLLDGRPQRIAADRHGRFELAAPAGTKVRIAPGAARDAFGNRNHAALSFTG